jgi:hypothetical protein
MVYGASLLHRELLDNQAPPLTIAWSIVPEFIDGEVLEGFAMCFY